MHVWKQKKQGMRQDNRRGQYVTEVTKYLTTLTQYHAHRTHYLGQAR